MVRDFVVFVLLLCVGLLLTYVCWDSPLLGALEEWTSSPNLEHYVPLLLFTSLGFAMFALRRWLHARDIVRQREEADAKILTIHNLYREAIENTQSMLYRLNFAERKYELIGGNCQEILGVAEADLTPEKWKSMVQETLVSSPTVTADISEYRKMYRRGEVNHYRTDVLMRTPQGKEKWLNDSAVAIRDEKTGTVIGSLGIVQDITDRKRSEERIRDKNERLEILNSVAQVTSGNWTPEEMCDRLLERICAAMTCEAFYISIYDQKTESTHAIRMYDTDVDGQLCLFPLASPLSISKIIGPVIHQRKPALINRDYEMIDAQGFVSFGNNRKSTALLFVPLVVGDRVLGILSVQQYGKVPYTEEHLELLVAIGHQVGPALDAAMLTSQLRRSEERLRQVHKIYQDVIENSDGLPYRLNYADTTYHYIGTNCEALLGVIPEGFGPGMWKDILKEVVITDSDALHDTKQYVAAFKRGEVRRYRTDLRIVTPQGEEKWLSDCSIPIWDEAHTKVIGSQGILYDITQRKRNEEKLVEANRRLEEDIEALRIAEEQLAKANKELRETTALMVHTERMNALGELTAGVAHELNQPLNNIKILCQSILRDIDKDRLAMEDLPQDLRDVVSQVTKMAGIIDHMRVFTRRSDGVYKQKTQVNTCVQNMFILLGQQLRNNSIDVKISLSEGLLPVMADPIALEQVATGFVVNARYALENFRQQGRRMEVRTYMYSDNEVAITVKDNGGGVPVHIRGRIFEPFFTTKPPGKGTGLGLSIAAKIIQEHNGRIDLQVDDGEGSAFTIILPAVDLS